MKSLSSILLISVALFLFSTYASAQVKDSLILYLSFDEDPDEGVRDLSQYGNNGEMKGEPEWVEGRFGKAL